MSFDTWYYELPTVTRWYLTLSVLTTAACFFDLVSPFTLYLNFRLIYEKYEVCSDHDVMIIADNIQTASMI